MAAASSLAEAKAFIVQWFVFQIRLGGVGSLFWESDILVVCGIGGLDPVVAALR